MSFLNLKKNKEILLVTSRTLVYSTTCIEQSHIEKNLYLSDRMAGYCSCNSIIDLSEIRTFVGVQFILNSRFVSISVCVQWSCKIDIVVYGIDFCCFEYIKLDVECRFYSVPIL